MLLSEISGGVVSFSSKVWKNSGALSTSLPVASLDMDFILVKGPRFQIAQHNFMLGNGLPVCLAESKGVQFFVIPHLAVA